MLNIVLLDSDQKNPFINWMFLFLETHDVLLVQHPSNKSYFPSNAKFIAIIFVQAYYAKV